MENENMTRDAAVDNASPSRSGLSRRTFLKSAVVASATPAAAFAPIMEKTMIGALVADYDSLVGQALDADEKANAIYNQPGRPELPMIRWAEIDVRYRDTIDRCDLYSGKSINRHFDRWPAGLVLYPTADKAVRVEAMEVEREKILALFQQRQEVYDQWEKASGHTAAEAESDRLWKLVNEAEERILSFPCTTLEDVVIQARFIKREFEGEMSAELGNRIVAQLASIGLTA